MKYVFRPSHDKCQDLTEAAGTANCNFPDFPNTVSDWRDYSSYFLQIILRSLHLLQYIVELWQILVICIISNVDFICFYT